MDKQMTLRQAVDTGIASAEVSVEGFRALLDLLEVIQHLAREAGSAHVCAIASAAIRIGGDHMNMADCDRQDLMEAKAEANHGQ